MACCLLHGVLLLIKHIFSFFLKAVPPLSLKPFVTGTCYTVAFPFEDFALQLSSNLDLHVWGSPIRLFPCLPHLFVIAFQNLARVLEPNRQPGMALFDFS